MSAYVVSKAHIDALVRFACQREMVWIQDEAGRWRYLDRGALAGAGSAGATGEGLVASRSGALPGSRAAG